MLNRAEIIGHLGQDPEVRYMPSGEAVANLSIATTEKWKDKTSGEKREHTEWHKVVLFARTAEVAQEYLRKGSKVYIEGSLRTRKWQDKQGTDRYTTEIRGDRLILLDGRDASHAPAAAQAKAARPAGRAAPVDEPNDDIPF